MTGHIVTWNVHGGVDGKGTPSTQHLSDTLLVRDLDVICLQEVPSRQWVVNPADVLDMFLHFQQTNASTGLGNAILTRSPGKKSTSCVLPLPWYRCKHTPRGALAVTFKDVTVVNTHLGADPTMYEQYVEAVALIKFMREIPGRVVVVGDFNAHYASPALLYMRSHGWRDMWRGTANRKHGYRAGCTFLARCPFQRIDYILCDPSEIISLKAEVLDGDDGRVSDHLGVCLDMLIPPT